MMVWPILKKDGYKTDHRRQYPAGTEEVYSNLTPRSSRDPRYKAVVVFGIQAFIEEQLMRQFHTNFFQQPKETVLSQYKRRLDAYLGPDSVPIEHIAELHDHGELPLRIKALPEGTLCPIGVPLLTIRNTDKRFFWLVNFLETLISTELWKPITSATIAFEYRKMFQRAALATNPEMLGFVEYQGHDFSMRGMDGIASAARSGAAHLLSFYGTDTLPAIDYVEHYYDADASKEVIGQSVPATEHSVMCMGGKESELDTFRRLMALYPKGILSVVSDTWDYWKVLTCILPQLKAEIMARDGKLVIRPDSGDPVKILCGDPAAPEGSPARRGSVQILWDIFGGSVTSTGYKQLNSHIGLIYGDSITIERAEEIILQLTDKGFASTNIVFGIGSFTYQYTTRDTFGMAIKATHGIINGEPVDIYKDPITDSGLKRSAKGYLRVNQDLTLSQCVTEAEEDEGMLQTVFEDGLMMTRESWAGIRARLHANLPTK